MTSKRTTYLYIRFNRNVLPEYWQVLPEFPYSRVGLKPNHFKVREQQIFKQKIPVADVEGTRTLLSATEYNRWQTFGET